MGTNTKTSYLDPPQLIGRPNADGTISITPLELKKLNDYNYYVAKMLQGGLNLANLNKETNQVFSDIEGNVTELGVTAQGLTLDVSNLAGDLTSLSVTVDGMRIADESGSYTIIDGDMLKSYNSTTSRQVQIQDGQLVILTQGDMVIGGLYSDSGKIVLHSDWGYPLKLVSANGVSIDASADGKIYIGTGTGCGGNVDIGQSSGTVNVIGTFLHNGSPIGAAVFT